MPSILNYPFTTKTALYNHCRALIASARNNERYEGSSHDFVSALFAGHPRVNEKINGRTISHFTASTNIAGSRCFYVVFEDGTMTAFSFHTCADEIFKQAA